jgi:hypothetical protein
VKSLPTLKLISSWITRLSPGDEKKEGSQMKGDHSKKKRIIEDLKVHKIKNFTVQ